MRVVQVNHRYDTRLADPETLLDRYTTLTGLSTALLGAGAESVRVVQHFHRDAVVTRDGVEYRFCATGVNRAVTDMEPDIVHVNGLDSLLRTWRLRSALRGSARMIVQDHVSQVPDERGGPAERWLRRTVRSSALRAPDAFFFTCAEHAEPWIASGLINPRQRVFEVLEAGTAIQPIDRAEALRASGVRGNPAVLWVGRLNATKDPLTVLDGFERALAFLPDAMLTMVYGEDDLLPAVRRRLESSSTLAGHVRLVGMVPHARIAAFYTAADIFVLGSHREGSGYALIEACACGAVPVVTRIAAFQAITGRGTIGRLWTPGDPAAFAEALVETARIDLGAARARCVEHFHRTLSWPVVGRQAMDAYAIISRGT